MWLHYCNHKGPLRFPQHDGLEYTFSHLRTMDWSILSAPYVWFCHSLGNKYSKFEKKTFVSLGKKFRIFQFSNHFYTNSCFSIDFNFHFSEIVYEWTWYFLIVCGSQQIAEQESIKKYQVDRETIPGS